MTVPVCTIDATGIHVPAYPDILAYFIGQYQAIYGADISLDTATQDYEWIAIQAAAINDANAMAVAVYNAYGPATGQGAGLSSIVKINGIARKVPSYSTVDVLVSGQVGAVISGGIVGDTGGLQWTLPATVTIPLSGFITVTATCTTLGANLAPPNTVTKIVTPTLGWQAVTNVAAATAGAPVENDAQLRIRQSLSTEIPALSTADSLRGALLALANVATCFIYDNDTNLPDVNGIPGHSMAVVIDGGDDTAIAQMIALKKAEGGGTYGSTSVAVTNSYGITRTIWFFRPSKITITYVITIKAMTGFTTAIQDQISKSIADWTNTLTVGQDVLLSRVYYPALLSGAAASQTYEISSIQAARDGSTPTTNDVSILFSEQPIS